MSLWKVIEKRLNEVCETETIYSLGFLVRFSIGLFLFLFSLFIIPLMLWAGWSEAIEVKSIIGMVAAALFTLLLVGGVIFAGYTEISDILHELKLESNENPEVKKSNKTTFKMIGWVSFFIIVIFFIWLGVSNYPETGNIVLASIFTCGCIYGIYACVDYYLDEIRKDKLKELNINKTQNITENSNYIKPAQQNYVTPKPQIQQLPTKQEVYKSTLPYKKEPEVDPNDPLGIL